MDSAGYLSGGRIFRVVLFATSMLLSVVYASAQTFPVLLNSKHCESIAVSSSGEFVYAACYSYGVISIRGSTVSIIANYTQCLSVSVVAVSNDGVVYAACSGRLISINGSTIATVLSPYNCNDVAVANTGIVYAAGPDGVVSIHDSTVSTIATNVQCPNARRVAVSTGGIVYAGCGNPDGADGASIISITGSIVSTIATYAQCPYANSVAVSTGGVVYASCGSDFNGGIISVNGSTVSIIATSTHCPTPARVAVSSGGTVYATCNTVGSVISITELVITTIASPTECPEASAVALSDTGRLYFGCLTGVFYTNGLNCPTGQYGVRSSNAANPCVPCPAGTYNSREGMFSISWCQMCPVGSFSDAGRSACTVCAAGSFGTLAGQPSQDAGCQLCPAGSFGTEPGLTSLATSCSQKCPPGAYGTLPGQTSFAAACHPCAPGTYQPNPAQAYAYSCLPCPPGTFSANTSAMSIDFCKPCPQGSASQIPGAPVCISCPKGKFQATIGQYDCLSCPSGKYQPVEGAMSLSMCLDCPLDAPISTIGSISITSCTSVPVGACAVGIYSSVGSRGACDSECEVGYFCVQGVRYAAPAGRFVNATGQVTPLLCPLGTYNPKMGSISEEACELCPVSTYADTPGGASCTVCPNGTASAIVGASAATSCIILSGCDKDLSAAESRSLCQLGITQSISTNSFLQSNALTYAMQSVSGSSGAIYTGDGSQSIRVSSGAALLPHVSNDASGAGIPSGQLASAGMVAVIVILSLCAVVPLILFRVLPIQWLKHGDLFNCEHSLREGEAITKKSTRWGLAVSVSYAFASFLVITGLAAASNQRTTSTLVPAVQAQAAFGRPSSGSLFLTLRAFGGPEGASMCESTPVLWSSSPTFTGLSNILSERRQQARSAAQDQSCVISIDCIACETSSVVNITVLLWWRFQIVEWQLQSSAPLYSTPRGFYGMLVQPSTGGYMLDGQSELIFSLFDSYYHDQITLSSSSGFELGFASYKTIKPQPASTITNGTHTHISFVLRKADTALTTVTEEKLSALQVVASILTSVVSLLSIYRFIFKSSEKYVINKFCVGVNTSAETKAKRAFETHTEMMSTDTGTSLNGHKPTSSVDISMHPMTPVCHTLSPSLDYIPEVNQL